MLHRAGKIPKEQLEIPKKTFAVMGALDSVARIMQIFAGEYNLKIFNIFIV